MVDILLLLRIKVECVCSERAFFFHLVLSAYVKVTLTESVERVQVTEASQRWKHTVQEP